MSLLEQIKEKTRELEILQTKLRIEETATLKDMEVKKLQADLKKLEKADKDIRKEAKKKK